MVERPPPTDKQQTVETLAEALEVTPKSIVKQLKILSGSFAPQGLVRFQNILIPKQHVRAAIETGLMPQATFDAIVADYRLNRVPDGFLAKGGVYSAALALTGREVISKDFLTHMFDSFAEQLKIPGTEDLSWSHPDGRMFQIPRSEFFSYVRRTDYTGRQHAALAVSPAAARVIAGLPPVEKDVRPQPRPKFTSSVAPLVKETQRRAAEQIKSQAGGPGAHDDGARPHPTPKSANSVEALLEENSGKAAGEAQLRATGPGPHDEEIRPRPKPKTSNSIAALLEENRRKAMERVASRPAGKPDNERGGR